MNSSRRLSVTLMSAIILATIVLFRCPPTQYAFYPRCPFETLFHLQCPGCGTTRAIACLLHGRVLEALRSNPLTVCTLPLAAVYAAIRSLRASVRSLGPPSPAILYASFTVVTLFTILRNL